MCSPGKTVFGFMPGVMEFMYMWNPEGIIVTALIFPGCGDWIARTLKKYIQCI
jgi:hypothetical protein